VLGVAGTPIQSRIDFRRQPRQVRREGFDLGRRRSFSSPRRARDPRRPLGLQGARGGPEATMGWAAGAGAARHVAAPEMPRAGQQELEPQDTWRPQSCPGLGSGSWNHRTRGGPGATPGWTAGAGAAGHVAAPELPRAGQRELEPQDTWRPRSCSRLGSGS
jgi:hypothetical protein